MAPGTRANSERGEGDLGDLELHDVAQASGTLDDGSSLKEEADGLVASSVDDLSQETLINLKIEKLESIVSKLAIALEYLQEQQSQEVGRMTSVLEKPHLTINTLDKASNAEKTALAATENRDKAANSLARDYDIYPTHIAYKIYQKGLQSTRCKRIGDGSFFVAKRCWDRLPVDFPTTQAGMKRLLPLTFDGDARLVYEEIANLNPNSSYLKLWDLLSKRLCNEIHQSALRDRFFAMTWDERKETFERFAWRLRSASLLLPDVIDDGLLLNRLKNGLPNRLQDQAKLVSGTFDEVVSRVSTLSTAKGHRPEMVREVRENGQTKEEFNGMQLATDRFANFRCHYCQRLGHISRDCEKKRNDRFTQGKGNPDQRSPSGPNPKQN